MQFSAFHEGLIHCQPTLQATAIGLRLTLAFPDASVQTRRSDRRLAVVTMSAPPGIPEDLYEALWHRTGLNSGVHRAIGELPGLPDMDEVAFTYDELKVDVDMTSLSTDEVACLAGTLESLSYAAAKDLIRQALTVLSMES